jgi:hypothetical protein
VWDESGNFVHLKIPPWKSACFCLLALPFGSSHGKGDRIQATDPKLKTFLTGGPLSA